MTTLKAPYSPDLPRVFTVHQRFPQVAALDVLAKIRAGFLVPSIQERLKPGMSVALAVGSRGITGLAEMVQAILAALREIGAKPFIVPAMGSHGGATVEGQLALLAGYGVTESALGVPIKPSMEVRSVGKTEQGVEAFVSVEALNADGVILLNRVKPHTDFGGELGSGLMKMLVVGLGKHVGAASFHRAAAIQGHGAVLSALWPICLEAVPVIAGVAVVENQTHQTTTVEVVPASSIETREKVWLREAAGYLPSLPFNDIDLMIIDRIGKNISGTGLDPNITGRHVDGYLSSLKRNPADPVTIRRLFVRDLTPESNGNAIGIGMADFTTARLVQAMDPQITYTNCLTALSIQAAKIPVTFDTDKEAIARALTTVGRPDVTQARVVRILDTLTLDQLSVSEAFASEVEQHPDLETMSALEPMQFDDQHNLLSMYE